MLDVIDWLKTFNAKERYFLLAYAQDQDALQLGPFFRGRLSQLLGITVPEDAFVAMDYHLDWLYAALHVAVHGPAGPGPDDSHKNVLEQVDGEQKRMIQGQQEDADLLIAFDLDGVTHLILVEVKGVTSWGNDQLRSKALRLKQIFHEDGKRWENVKPHFILMSPRKDKRLKVEGFPRWMLSDQEGQEQKRLPWLPLRIKGLDEIKKVTRCEKEKGKEVWHNWKLTKR
jgi:hypothetical protein